MKSLRYLRLKSLGLRSLLVALACGGAFASVDALACYTVYDSASRIVYSGEAPPVDMSLPLHEALASRFPGGHLVFDAQSDCPGIATTPMAKIAREGTPLFTNTSTAQAMGAHYTALGGGIALVQAGEADVRPGVTVVVGQLAN